MKNKKVDKDFLIVVRYLILFGLMFSVGIIYFIFTPLTIYSVASILKLFFEGIAVRGDIILIKFISIQIIPACVAGSAYLLLLILNLGVSMKWKKRFYSILLSFVILFVLNVLRIVLLASLYVYGNQYFDFTHKIFWYGLSTVFVVAIWFLMVKIFSIEEVPFYSDVKYFIGEIKGGIGRGNGRVER